MKSLSFLLLFVCCTSSANFYVSSAVASAEAGSKSLVEGLEIREDFILGTTTDGQSGFTTSVSNSGGVAITNTVQDANHMGQLALKTNANAAATAAVLWGQLTVDQFILGSGAWEIKSAVYVDRLSDGTDSFYLMAGFCDVEQAGDCTDGVYFLYDTEGTIDAGSGSANWICRTISNSSATEAVSTVAVAEDEFVKLEIDINAAGDAVVWKVNGTTVCGGHDGTNVPTGATRATNLLAKVVKTNGTTGVFYFIDYMNADLTLTNER